MKGVCRIEMVRNGGLAFFLLLALASCVTGTSVTPGGPVTPVVRRGAPSVSNVAVRQEATGVVVTYDLSAEEPRPVTVRASADGGATWDVKLGHLSGDVGDGVAPGTGKRIAWDALKDYPDGATLDALIFEVATEGYGFTLTDPVAGMVFVCVDGGTFEMGDTFGDGSSDEKPVHTVTVSDFCIGRTEVTQGQWEQVMGSNPSRFVGAERPVEQVSWSDVQEFLRKLNQKSGKTYRLPTEAEWEYAVRSGGQREKWAGTSSESELGGYAWYAANSGIETHPVGRKQPNGLGLYDMSGNVWEWCADWYDAGYYGKSPRDNAAGSRSGSRRVLRGGSWNRDPRYVRSADRYWNDPANRYDYLGFRLLRKQ